MKKVKCMPLVMTLIMLFTMLTGYGGNFIGKVAGQSLVSSVDLLNENFDNKTLDLLGQKGWSILGATIITDTKPEAGTTNPKCAILGGNLSTSHWIITNSIDTSNFSNLTMEYSARISAPSINDRFRVEYSTDNGTTWNLIDNYDFKNQTEFTSGVWKHVAARPLDSNASHRDGIKFRFMACNITDPSKGTSAYIRLDDIIVKGTPSDVAIKSLTVSNQTKDTEIDAVNGIIKFYIPKGTDKSNITTTVTLAEGSYISLPAGAVGTSNPNEYTISAGFSGPVAYRVTAADGSYREWTVQAVDVIVNLPEVLLSENFDASGISFLKLRNDGWSKEGPSGDVSGPRLTNDIKPPSLTANNVNCIYMGGKPFHSITTKAIGLKGYGNITLDYNIRVNYNTPTANDVFIVEYSTDDGNHWNTAYNMILSASQAAYPNGVWKNAQQVVMGQNVNNADHVKFRFTIKNTAGGTNPCYVRLDDIVVKGTVAGTYKEITGFQVPLQVPKSTVIDPVNHTVVFHMYYGATVNAVKPELNVSAGASVYSPATDTVDFSINPVLYTIEAQDGSRQQWQVSCRVDTVKPPSNLRVDSKNVTALTLAWDPNNGYADEYRVYKKDSAGSEVLVATLPSSASRYAVSNLEPGKLYSFTVRTKYGAQVSENSNSVTAAAGEFSVVGSKILAPDGGEFVSKGVNVHGYNTPWNGDVLKDLTLIKDVWKFNTIRIYCRIDSNNVSLEDNGDIQHLYDIIDTYTAQGIVCMVEVHDKTGDYFTDTSTPSLTDLANFHKNLAVKYKGNPYVWFNVMNEPGAFSSQWKTTHQRVIQAIRDDAGANNIIVADGSNYASEIPTDHTKCAILQYGQDLLNFNSKSYSNIVFSIHMYHAWNNNTEALLTQYIDAVQAKGFALLLGEIAGDDCLPALRGSANVAFPRNIGRLAWSWLGGDNYKLTTGGGGVLVDRVDGTTPTNLTLFGEVVWEDTHGTLLAKLPINDADVSVENVYTDKAVFNAGDTVSFMAILKNSGLDALTTNDTVKIKLYADDVELPAEILYNGNLEANKSVVVKSSPWIASKNNFQLKAIIDPVESSYGNDPEISNNLKNTFVDGRGDTLGADLAITGITADSDNLTYAQSARFSVTVKNVGRSPVSSGNYKITLYKNGVLWQECSLQGVSLAPGESRGVAAAELWQATEAMNLQAILTSRASGDSNVANEAAESSYNYSGRIDNVNLIPNPGFENGLWSWYKNYGGMTLDSTNPYEGNYALKVSGKDKGGRILLPGIKPDSTYYLSIMGMNEGTPSASSDIVFQYNDASGVTNKTFIKFTDAGGYEKKEIRVKTPSVVADPSIVIYLNGNNVFYVDSFMLTHVPDAPQDLQAEIVTGEEEVQLTWSPSHCDDLAGYSIYRDGERIDLSVTGAVYLTETAYTVKKLADGQTYRFQVTAIDEQGYESDVSNEVIVTIPEQQGSPARTNKPAGGKKPEHPKRPNGQK